MNVSTSSRLRGPLWPTEEVRPGPRNATAIAIVAAVAIEGALVAAVMSTHAPTAPAKPPMPIMQIRIVKAEPPPPAPPPPIIKKVVKQQSEVPTHRTITRPAAPPKRHVAPTPAPVSVPTQPAPSEVQTVPNPPAPAPVAAAPATVPAPKTATAAEPADIAIVCPVQVKPDMPARALAEGIVGAVTARATIQGGKVVRVDVVKSEPPGVFDASVRRAMAQYQCKVEGDDRVVVEQSFDFTQSDAD
jgi:periplasmic protein TonB